LIAGSLSVPSLVVTDYDCWHREDEPVGADLVASRMAGLRHVRGRLDGPGIERVLIVDDGSPPVEPWRPRLPQSRRLAPAQLATQWRCGSQACRRGAAAYVAGSRAAVRLAVFLE
jgi:hypothetical protein